MKTASSHAISAKTVIFALASATALIGTVAWRHLKPPAGMVDGSPLTGLRQQAESLRESDDIAAAGAETTRTELMDRLWTAKKLDAWKEKIPSKWTLQEAKPQQNVYTVTRRFVLNRPSAGARDWPEIYGVLQQIDSLPAAMVAGLTLTMPQPQTRQFQTVQVVLALAFSNESHGETAANGNR